MIDEDTIGARLLLVLIIRAILALFVTMALISFVIGCVAYYKGLVYEFGIKDIAFKSFSGGIITGIAGWLMLKYKYKNYIRLGKKTVTILRKNGYQARINSITLYRIKPFYKINGELFYLYAPIAHDMSFFLEGFKRLAKYASQKNIVINLADGSVKLDKLEAKLSAKYADKFDKIIIIDKAGQVIRFK